MTAYSTLFAFGDSLSDAGPYYAGHFSNGPTWVEDLSQMLLGPSEVLKPSLEGGNDFAFGGAQTGTTAIEGLNPIDLPAQIADYALSHPKAVPGALYTLDIGANDIMNSLSEFAAGKLTLGGVITVRPPWFSNTRMEPTGGNSSYGG